jgi:hypothetical protein
MYGFIFVLVNITYLLLVRETISARKPDMPNQATRLFHLRSVLSIIVFGCAMIIALWHPYIGFGINCACLALYLRPGLRGMKV